jgi:hypothetical protein
MIVLPTPYIWVSTIAIRTCIDIISHKSRNLSASISGSTLLVNNTIKRLSVTVMSEARADGTPSLRLGGGIFRDEQGQEAKSDDKVSKPANYKEAGIIEGVGIHNMKI